MFEQVGRTTNRSEHVVSCAKLTSHLQKAAQKKNMFLIDLPTMKPFVARYAAGAPFVDETRKLDASEVDEFLLKIPTHEMVQCKFFGDLLTVVGLQNSDSVRQQTLDIVESQTSTYPTK